MKLNIVIRGNGYRYGSPNSYLEGLGVRRGEILALRWQDVDIENSKIAIKRNLVKVRKELIFKEPKTETSIRKIEMPNSLVK